ncbi:hypothetical protein [Catellatospora sichuanensis]|uniref:hypothetical protein n=1 Tax=Catellatospora sichuanensis TaxID=1969805 RepID=UPI0011842B3B|nr:hypothetical protein [Catellatospora sichuanensis]
MGDVWRMSAGDQAVRVKGLSKREIRIEAPGPPQEFGWAFPYEDWDYTLYRIREDLGEVHVGDFVHLHVPATDVYLLDVNLDERWPALSQWFAFRVGEPPEPELGEGGLRFHPAEDDSMSAELVFRPFSMLDDGMRVDDAASRAWTFRAPFFFTDDTDARGVPSWPLEVPGSAEASALLNHTSLDVEVAAFEKAARVDFSVFDVVWPDCD